MKAAVDDFERVMALVHKDNEAVYGKRIGLDTHELHMRKPGHTYLANGKYANAWGWTPVNAQPSMWSRFDGGGTLWARKGENQQTRAGPYRAGTLSWRFREKMPMSEIPELGWAAVWKTGVHEKSILEVHVAWSYVSFRPIISAYGNYVDTHALLDE